MFFSIMYNNILKKSKRWSGFWVFSWEYAMNCCDNRIHYNNSSIRDCSICKYCNPRRYLPFSEQWEQLSDEQRQIYKDVAKYRNMMKRTFGQNDIHTIPYYNYEDVICTTKIYLELLWYRRFFNV